MPMRGVGPYPGYLDDMEPGWETTTGYYNNYGSNYYQYNRKRNAAIKIIAIEPTIGKIAPLIKRFRENGRPNEDKYKKLLKAMCEVVEVPKYKPNIPTFVYRKGLKSATSRWAQYDPRLQSKNLILGNLQCLKEFLCLWYLYLDDRNEGFFETRVCYPGRFQTAPDRKYAEAVLEHSTPKRVRRLKERALLELVEI